MRLEQQNLCAEKTAAHRVNTGDSGHTRNFCVSPRQRNANCMDSAAEHLFLSPALAALKVSGQAALDGVTNPTVPPVIDLNLRLNIKLHGDSAAPKPARRHRRQLDPEAI